MQRLLTQEHEQLLQQERELLGELRTQLAKLDASNEDLDLLKQSLRQLEELFLLVIVGEFNAGKTAFLNAMLGEAHLKEGVTPTTDQIHLLRYGESRHEGMDDDVLVMELPVEWLREVNLVDTPGANAVIQRHQEITEHFIPRSDLVLFVTSADRPFSESERLFLERIQQWGKKIVIVVNKIDLIKTSVDRTQILDFVSENASALLNTTPQLFAVSARQALEAKQNGNSADLQQSQFEALETFILESLNTKERLRLKLENPLGVANRLLDKYNAVVSDRQQLLSDDFNTLDIIETQLGEYEIDMKRDFKYHSSHVDNVLYEMAERGDRFFDDQLRVTNILALMNSEKLRAEFEREVVGETSRQIERQVNDLIDWLVDKDYQQWRNMMTYINRRANQHADRMVGHVQGDFEFNRQKLLTSVGRDAQRVVDSYDREAESLKLSQQVQMALLQTAAVEAGALGLGALLVTLLQPLLLDVTGILSASAIAVLGLYVLPYRRTKIKEGLRDRIEELRAKLNTAMDRQFETELNNSMQRVREAIAPYTRFVRVEREKLDNLQTELEAISGQLTEVRTSVQKL
ncbi:dynamin family protein [Chloroflexi bacterium TSY]|nr:dynamin family protein [Chloroflexi bacterium TSY]